MVEEFVTRGNLPEPEIQFVNKAQDGDIKITNYKEQVKFINLITEDKIIDDFEISTRTKIGFKYIIKSDTIEGLEIKKYVRASPNVNYELIENERVHLSGITLAKIVEFINIISSLNLKEFTNNKIKLNFDNENVIDNSNLSILKTLLNDKAFVEKIKSNEILSTDLLKSVQISNRRKVIEHFIIDVKDETKTEKYFQHWFQQNKWVFGNELVEILDNRKIDANHTSDYITKHIDGFADLIEIKSPKASKRFWEYDDSHKNYYPSKELSKSITQCLNYLYELERESDSRKFSETHNNLKIIKPRAILVYGTKVDWNDEQHKMFRILNSSFNNLQITTYDDIIERANLLLKLE